MLHWLRYFGLCLWPWIFKVKLYLGNGRPDCHGTKGMGVNRMPWCKRQPLCDLETEETVRDQGNLRCWRFCRLILVYCICLLFISRKPVHVCFSSRNWVGNHWLRYYLTHRQVIVNHRNDRIHKSHNVAAPYPTMHHFVADMCRCVHISVTKWCIVGHLSEELWDCPSHDELPCQNILISNAIMIRKHPQKSCMTP